jgi:hypothetical protein
MAGAVGTMAGTTAIGMGTALADHMLQWPMVALATVSAGMAALADTAAEADMVAAATADNGRNAPIQQARTTDANAVTGRYFDDL